MKPILRKLIFWMLSAGLLLAACVPMANPSPTSTPVPPPTATRAEQTPSAVLAAQTWLANKLGVSTGEIELAAAQAVEWRNSCLGLAEPKETCAEVITPGWRIDFRVEGAAYTVHTDKTGAKIRLAPAIPSVNLDHTQWNLVSVGPAGAARPLVPGSNISLSLGNGQAEGTSGCNSYGGTYQVHGNTLQFSNLVTTLMACMDAEIMNQEQAYLAALNSAGVFSLVNGQLIISYDAGANELIFEQPGPMPQR